ncbi:hypothetical protein ES332_D11G392900v1 [Gossypium tomentosum]|uniref:Uncharacterized protein n=1 Tax=Gossypium tomentosum TaxID=34277 RepID=A0A5D2IX69_GOSTO|nr:hypothetical protein ES332_D11G392900v1 [Gossypium tomentosum]
MKLVADKRSNGTTGEVYVPLGDKTLEWWASKEGNTCLWAQHHPNIVGRQMLTKGMEWYFSICGKCIVDAYLEDCSKFVDSYCGELFYFIM